MENFVNLHSHTNHSHMDAIIRIPDLFRRVAELGQPGIAITDHGVLSGIHEGYKEYKKYREQGQNIKFIPGCEIYYCDDISDPKSKRRHIVLLAQNEEGYRNLLRINAAGFKNSVTVMGRQFPRVDFSILKQHKEGLFVNSACGGSPFAAAIFEKNLHKAKDLATRFRDEFGDKFYIELQPHDLQRGDFNQSLLNEHLKALAEELGVGMIATCDSHYLTSKHEKYHDMILAIGSKKALEDPTRHRYATYLPCLICGGSGEYPAESKKECYQCGGSKYGAIKPCPEFYLKGREQLVEYFSKKFDINVANTLVDNTVKIANQCEYPDYMAPKSSRIPKFNWKAESDADEFLRWQSNKPAILDMPKDAAYLRFKVKKAFDVFTREFNVEKKKIYWERVLKELDILEAKNFSSYMLIVADFTNWAEANDIVVGPGRGCLDGYTNVLTSNNGFVRIQDLQIGDCVFTHTGEPKAVLDTFKYDIDEECLSIKSMWAERPLILTKDHKIYASRRVNGELLAPEFIEASKLNVGDFIFSPKLKRQVLSRPRIDLLRFVANMRNMSYDESFIYRKAFISDKFSAATGIPRGAFIRAMNNKWIPELQMRALVDYLIANNNTLSNWVLPNRMRVQRIPRYLEFTDDFAYFIGRWIGDGCLPKNKVVISFNANDTAGMDKISNIARFMGLDPHTYFSTTCNGANIEITNCMFHNFFKSLWGRVTKAKDKHIGKMKYYDDAFLRQLLQGLSDSDGHVAGNRTHIKTISKRLALDIKEICDYLGMTSSIYDERRIDVRKGFQNSAKSYVVGFVPSTDKVRTTVREEGRFCKISEIATARPKAVYDIMVADNHSFITTSGAVHNSCAGSLIGRLLGIHAADPIKYGLLFERFQNKEKMSAPDIDQDLAASGREKVIEYVRRRYGDDYVAAISNVNRITPKIAIKDIARSLVIGGDKSTAFSLANSITSDIPDVIMNGDKRIKVDTIEKAMGASVKLKAFLEQYPAVREYAEQIIGSPRAWSMHAAGIVISDTKLDSFVPLRRDKEGALITQYDKETVEEIGLLKMDFLGLETLDILSETYFLAHGINMQLPRSKDVPDGDKMAYAIIGAGLTTGIFQLSGSLAALCKALKPQSIEDISLINALGRPSCSKDERREFISRKTGASKVKYLHPILEPCLNHTYGISVYEEDLMMLANHVAGWDLSEADGLRKLTKLKEKGASLAKKLEDKFISDTRAHSGKNNKVVVIDDGVKPNKIWSSPLLR